MLLLIRDADCGQILGLEGDLPLRTGVGVGRGRAGWEFNRLGLIMGLVFGPLLGPLFRPAFNKDYRVSLN